MNIATLSTIQAAKASADKNFISPPDAAADTVADAQASADSPNAAQAQRQIDAVKQTAPDYAAGEKLATKSSELSQKAGFVAAALGGPVALASLGVGMAAGQVGQNLAMSLHADEYAAKGLQALGMHGIGQISPSGPNPARMGDPIAHSFAAAGLLATVVLGAIAAVAVAALVVATGGVAAVAMLGAAAAGGLVGGFAGASLGNALAQMGTVTGAIVNGSSNVRIQGKPAARMTDIAACSKEPAPIPLVEGSETVFVNGLPLARVGHKLLCGAVVDKGASTVFTDRTTQACAQAAPDVPVWLRVAVDWVGFLPIGAGAAKASRYMKRTVSRVRRGNQPPSKCQHVGEPVNVVTGAFYEQREDLLIPGSLPLQWQRSYNSNHLAANPSLFGPGYSDSFSVCLRREADGNLAYWDADGQCLVFHTPEQNLQAGHLMAPELLLCGTQQAPRLFDLQSGISLHFAWLAQDDCARLYKVSDEAGNFYQLHYSQHSNLSPNACQTTAAELRSAPRLASISHSDGYRLRCDWQDDAHGSTLSLVLEEVGEAAQEVLRYGFETLPVCEQYQAGQRLIRCNSEFSGHMCYAYHQQGRMRAWWDSDATQVQLEYDAQGRICNVHTPGHILATRLAYAEHGEGEQKIFSSWLWFRDANGVEGPASKYEANAAGLLIRATNPQGQVSSQEWDADEHLIATCDHLQQRCEYAYDQQGRLLRMRDPQGHSSSVEYDERGRLSRLQDGFGRSTEWEYGSKYGSNQSYLQRVRESAAGQSRERRFYWRADGLLAAVEQDGQRNSYAYDAQKRPCGQTLANGAHAHWQQNRVGRVYSHTDALGQTTRFEYAPADAEFGPIKHAQRQPSLVRLANGDTLGFRFDREGRITEQRDASGAVRRYEWGALDILLAEIDPAGQRTSYSYDSQARLQKVSNALRQHWQFERDSAGRLQRETDFHGRVTEYQHDAQGRLLRKITAGHSVLEYRWDTAERLQETRSGEISLRFTYDAQGRLHSAQRWHADQLEAENQFQYDAWGQLLQDAQSTGALHWRWSADGQLQRSEHAYGRSQAEYDALGQLHSLHLGSGDIYLQRDVLGREIGRANLNLFSDKAKLVAAQALVPHFHLQQTYDPLGHIRSQQLLQRDLIGQHSPAISQLRSYQWQHGQLQQVDDARFGRRQYQHDACARVLRSSYESGPLQSEEFAYDALGDTMAACAQIRPGHTGAAHDSSFGMGQARHMQQGRVSSIDHHGRRQTCHYDKAGRLLEKVETRAGFRPRRWRYTWDGFDRLLSLHTSDGQLWHYAYDAFGRRIRKTCIQRGQISAQNQGQGRGHYAISSEECLWDGARLAVQKKIWRARGASVSAEAATEEERQEIFVWHYEGQSFKPLALEYYKNGKNSADGRAKQAELLHLITDQIGSLREAVNQSGEVVWAAESQTWGQLQQIWQAPKLAKPNWQNTSAANDEGIQLDLRQANQWQDAESGLFYNYQRYYDPQLGHYISSDPLGLAGGMRAYGYVDNPLTWMDPLGLSGCRVRELSEKIAAQMLKQTIKKGVRTDLKFQCRIFAKKLQVAMSKEKVNGEKIVVESRLANIESMKDRIISENGYHEAIKFGDTIFDNMNPSGVKYNDWMFDLGINDPNFSHYFKVTLKEF